MEKWRMAAFTYGVIGHSARVLAAWISIALHVLLALIGSCRISARRGEAAK